MLGKYTNESEIFVDIIALKCSKLDKVVSNPIYNLIIIIPLGLYSHSLYNFLGEITIKCFYKVFPLIISI